MTQQQAARRRTSFSGWESLLGLDGSAPSTVDQAVDGQAVVYLRVSDPRQMLTAIDIDADGNSIATQREACVLRAKRAKAPIAAEFVEPGNSAQSIAKRPVFREMLHYIEEHPEVSYLVIYMRSRAFRNLADAAITKRILASMGVKLISAKEDFGEGYMADAMEAVTDIMNEVQVRQSGEDIRQKMRHKAVNGGTIGRAKLGYINDRKEFDGRLVNTISLDEERAPLIRFAFEQYASDRYSVWQLANLLGDMGLTSRGPRDQPTRAVSTSALAKILRDRYYTGMLPYKGELYEGRHPALVSQETFQACQVILDRRNRRGDRDFIHFHYLKGLLYCGLCKAEGRTRRLVYTQSQGNGGVYEYWVCSGKTRDHCHLPSLRLEAIEEAVAQEVKREGLTVDEIAVMRAQLQETADEMQAHDRQVKASLRSELRKLEGQEERLIELATEGSVSTPKLREKLNDITMKKRVIEEKLTHTIERLAAGAERAGAQLDLLERIGTVYESAGENVRRDLIAGLFNRFTVFIDEEGIPALDGERTVINEAVHVLNRRNSTRSTSTKTKRASRDSAEGSLLSSLQATFSSEGWNIHDMVGVTGFEPAASSSRTTRATKLRHTPWPTL